MAAIDPRALMWTKSCELIDRAERLHRQFFQPRVEPVRDVYWEPPVDIVETASEVLVTIAFPGVDAGAVKVSVDAGELSVVGVRRPSSIPRGSIIHRLEIPYGRFERHIAFPGMRLRLGQSQLTDGNLTLRFSKQPFEAFDERGDQ